MNVKAKTGEHVGPIGRGEAIACEAVVLIEPRPDGRRSPTTAGPSATACPSTGPNRHRRPEDPHAAPRLQHADPDQGTVPDGRPRQGRHVRLRADGLLQEPHRPHGRAGHLRHDQALPRLPRLRVTWVVNITDVDDKLIVQAQKDGTTVKELAERVTADYLDCLAALGVDGIDHMPRATEHIAEIIEITQGLIDKGFAYASGGDVYFDVTRAPEYGKLSHRDPEELQAGARIEPTVAEAAPGRLRPLEGLEARRAVLGEPLGARAAPAGTSSARP